MKSTIKTVTVHLSRAYAFADLTDDLRRAIKDSGITDGSVNAFCAHTTCSLLINELEEGVLEDLASRLGALVPEDAYYAHDDLERRTANLEDPHERRNGYAHVSQMILGGTSQVIPVQAGGPMLGRWQRLLFIELDEPRDRRVIFHVTGE